MPEQFLITALPSVFWWRRLDDLMEENAALRARVERLEILLATVTSGEPEESVTDDE